MDRWVEAADWIVWQLVRRDTSATPAPPATRGSGRTAVSVAGLPRRARTRTSRTCRRQARPSDAAARRPRRRLTRAGGGVDRAARRHRCRGRQRRRPRHRARGRAVEPGQLVADHGDVDLPRVNGDELAEVPGMCGVVDGGIVAGLGATRPARAASATSSAGSSTTRAAAYERRPTPARPCTSSSPSSPPPSRSASTGSRAGLAQRQPFGARRPRALRPARRADPGDAAGGRLPRSARVHCLRHPHDHRGVRDAGWRSTSLSSPGACQQPVADADLRRRARPAAVVIGTDHGPAFGPAIHAAVAAGLIPTCTRPRRRWAGRRPGTCPTGRTGRGIRRALRALPALHDHFGRTTPGCTGCAPCVAPQLSGGDLTSPVDCRRAGPSPRLSG